MAKKLNEIMDSVAARMRADFETASFQHAGETGTAREKIVADMISKYLPGHVQAFHGGEIVTADGAVSRQCDVLICDRSAPPLIDMDSYRVVPSETVYGVVEVKSRLTGKELVGACENIKAAKKLAKTAFYPEAAPRYERYDKVFDYFPTYGVIFAFDSIDMHKLGEHFATWCAKNETEHLPDSVWVLGKGYLTFMNKAHRRPQLSPSGTCDFDLIGHLGKGDVLFPFVLYLNMAFAQARMRPLSLLDYAGTSLLGGHLRSWIRSAAS